MAVQELLLTLSVSELDALFANVVMTPEADAKDGDAHWHYYNFEADSRANREKTLMYSLKSRYLNVRRVMYVLYHHTDPVFEHRLQALCGDETCVNPLHMQLIK